MDCRKAGTFFFLWTLHSHWTFINCSSYCCGREYFLSKRTYKVDIERNSFLNLCGRKKRIPLCGRTWKQWFHNIESTKIRELSKWWYGEVKINPVPTISREEHLRWSKWSNPKSPVFLRSSFTNVPRFYLKSDWRIKFVFGPHSVFILTWTHPESEIRVVLRRIT